MKRIQLSPNLRNALVFLGAFAIAFTVFIIVYLTRPVGFDAGEAEIIRFESYYDVDHTSYHTIVRYIYQGTTYESQLDSYSSTYQIGQIIQVLINPKNPLDVRVANMDWLPWVILGISGLSLGASIFFFIRLILNKKKTEQQQPSVTQNEQEINTDRFM